MTDHDEQRTPKFSEDDIIIAESHQEYNADSFPAIVLEVMEETAGESEIRHSDGEMTTVSKHYGAQVADSDPIYLIHDLVIENGELKPGYSEYRMPEGMLRATADTITSEESK